MIRQKRIRNLDLHLEGIKQGATVICAVELAPHQKRAVEIGFSPELKAGEMVLPKVVGPITRFNAEGRWLIHRNQPMETAYREVEWHWTEWHGDQEVEQSDFRYAPYQRYPRTFVESPSVELALSSQNLEGLQLIVGPSLKFEDKNRERLMHVINLFLELFEACDLLDADLSPVKLPKVKRLNWHILPPGKRPWAEMKKALNPLLETATPGKRAVVEHRLETVNGFGPAFAAIGTAGFAGYVILGLRMTRR